MSNTILTHTLNLENEEEEDDLLQRRLMNPESKYEKESIIDCPDCFDTMIKAYDSEARTRFYCENCDYLWVGY